MRSLLVYKLLNQTKCLWLADSDLNEADLTLANLIGIAGERLA